MHSKLDFWLKTTRKETNVPLHKRRLELTGLIYLLWKGGKRNHFCLNLLSIKLIFVHPSMPGKHIMISSIWFFSFFFSCPSPFHPPIRLKTRQARSSTKEPKPFWSQIWIFIQMITKNYCFLKILTYVFTEPKVVLPFEPKISRISSPAFFSNLKVVCKIVYRTVLKIGA